jgi:hypothetical protein
MSRRAEVIALAAALLLAAGFALSFVAGLLPDREPRSAALPEPIEHRAAELPAAAEGAVRVEVLNAAGRGGLARLAMDRLREAGFDVVYFGTSGRDVDSSIVLDRSGRRNAANAVAQRLGIQRVRTQRDSSLLLDVTVILGVDYAAQRSVVDTIR